MTLTVRQIQLVQNSWEAVLTHAKEAGDIFYTRLFVIDPSLRPLFKGDMKTQASTLVNMITVVVRKLMNIEDIVADVKALGVRHKNYNVKPEHYTTVAEALLWTLEKGLGDQWNEETKNAWIETYTLLSTTMISAAGSAN